MCLRTRWMEFDWNRSEKWTNVNTFGEREREALWKTICIKLSKTGMTVLAVVITYSHCMLEQFSFIRLSLRFYNFFFQYKLFFEFKILLKFIGLRHLLIRLRHIFTCTKKVHRILLSISFWKREIVSFFCRSIRNFQLTQFNIIIDCISILCFLAKLKLNFLQTER